LNTFDERIARERESLPGYRLLNTAAVRVERLDDVLSRQLPRDRHIDFLSIDAEGFDSRVLASNDWSRFRPRCVLVEALHTTLATVSASPVHEQLSSVGYELHAKMVNSLMFIDREARHIDRGTE